MTALTFWLSMAFLAALALIIHSGDRKPSNGYGPDKYPHAFWNWPYRN